MADQPTPLITVEEFAAMRQEDDWKEELLDGAIVRTAPGSASHGISCANLARLLGDYCHSSRRGIVSLGSGLIVARHPDSVLAPDLSVWSSNRPPGVANDWSTVPPVWVAEVVGSVAEAYDAVRKMPYYFSFGIDVVWLVWLQRQVVDVHKLASHPRPFDPWEWRYEGYGRKAVFCQEQLLDGGDVLPGFSCKVSELFT
jgi:Uma2 family endonuclease